MIFSTLSSFCGDRPHIDIDISDFYIGQVLLRASIEKEDVVETPFGTELKGFSLSFLSSQFLSAANLYTQMKFIYVSMENLV